MHMYLYVWNNHLKLKPSQYSKNSSKIVGSKEGRRSISQRPADVTRRSRATGSDARTPSCFVRASFARQRWTSWRLAWSGPEECVFRIVLLQRKYGTVLVLVYYCTLPKHGASCGRLFIALWHATTFPSSSCANTASEIQFPRIYYEIVFQ